MQVPDVEPSGWAFEFENDLYPDIDDTAVVLLALEKASALDESTRNRAVRWVLAMQSRNGGWAAFDKDNTSRLPAMLPFCDFGEVIDPPSADVTAHVLEMLCSLPFERRDHALRRALRYLYAQQEKEGSWFGRWGVNHIYGVGAVLPALAAAGEDMDGLAVRRAVRWLEDRQNTDGGWGESCASYVDAAARGRGESTASQTAWALLGLVAAGRADSPIAHRGARWLLDCQRPDGAWDEESFTGCGFPGYGIGEERGARIFEGRELCAGFMIRYHLYRNCFPLLALGRYRSALRRLRHQGKEVLRSDASPHARHVRDHPQGVSERVRLRPWPVLRNLGRSAEQDLHRRALRQRVEPAQGVHRRQAVHGRPEVDPSDPARGHRHHVRDAAGAPEADPVALLRLDLHDLRAGLLTRSASLAAPLFEAGATLSS